MDLLTPVSNLPQPVQAAIIGATATGISALLGFSAVFVQIGRQGKNAIRANRENEAVKRKLEIYELTLETTTKAHTAILDLTSYVQRYLDHIRLQQILVEMGLRFTPPGTRYAQYIELRFQATRAVVDIIQLIESWHIVEPKLDIFRLALSMGLDRLYNEPSDVGLRALSSSMAIDGYESFWTIPGQPTIDTINRFLEDLRQQFGLLAIWVGDFKVEMQILLLSDLFPNQVERRDPPDRSQFCIRLDRYDEIKEKIMSSDWALRHQEQEAEAWQRFSGQQL